MTTGSALLLTALLASCGVAADPAVSSLPDELSDWPEVTVTVETGDRSHEVSAAVAATPERRQRGLQGVSSLADGAGMLFVFPEDTTGAFWMRDTEIPLEIAFAAADGGIVGIRSMEPCEADPCPRYAPDAPYRVALEVPDGWLAERDVGIGDRLVWPDLPADG